MTYRWDDLSCSTFTPLRLQREDTLIPKLLGLLIETEVWGFL